MINSAHKNFKESLSRDIQDIKIPFSSPFFIQNVKGNIQAALMLEKISYEYGIFSLEGWTIGKSKINLEFGNKRNLTKILRYPRPDVAQLYSLDELTEKDLGFRIFQEQVKTNSPESYFIWSSTIEKKEYVYLFPLHALLGQYSNVECFSGTKSQKIDPLLNLNKDYTVSLPYLSKEAEDVLIVGSAPSIEYYRDEIKKSRGERWALNDALFYLEKNNISVEKTFITDTRFIKKTFSLLIQSRCPLFITLDTVNPDLIKALKKNFFVFKSLGRDGFSSEYGKVFHGCSVFFCALQTAVALKYQSITTCGVIFPPPSRYARIDQSKNLPEFVHTIQLSNARRALSFLRKIDLDLKIIEPESNLNFL